MDIAAITGVSYVVFLSLLLIAQQALQNEAGRWGLDAFWQLIESKRFINGLWNTLYIAILATLGCLVIGSVLSLILVFIPFPKPFYHASD